ncbi:MAG: pilus assembly protein [Thermomicrobiales bacterium]|nr:pilus assembly protein [Thermomicrobiales bacterium]
MPMLVLMLSGVFELGRFIHATACISHAAREGARLAMDPANDEAAIRFRVVESGRPITIDSGDIGISDRTAGEPVTITVRYAFSSPIPLIHELWGGDSYEISRSRVARVVAE